MGKGSQWMRAGVDGQRVIIRAHTLLGQTIRWHDLLTAAINLAGQCPCQTTVWYFKYHPWSLALSLLFKYFSKWIPVFLWNSKFIYKGLCVQGLRILPTKKAECIWLCSPQTVTHWPLTQHFPKAKGCSLHTSWWAQNASGTPAPAWEWPLSELRWTNSMLFKSQSNLVSQPGPLGYREIGEEDSSTVIPSFQAAKARAAHQNSRQLSGVNEVHHKKTR